jgi:hypothetical protein
LDHTHSVTVALNRYFSNGVEGAGRINLDAHERECRHNGAPIPAPHTGRFVYSQKKAITSVLTVIRLTAANTPCHALGKQRLAPSSVARKRSIGT